MPSLTIRNLSEELLARLRRAAKEEQRSVNSQALQWLDDGGKAWTSKRERMRLLADIRATRESTRRKDGAGMDSSVLTRRIRDRLARG